MQDKLREGKAKGNDLEAVPAKADAVLWRIPAWFPELSKEQIDALRKFHLELIRFNGTLNLISPTTEREADKIHFADCINAARNILGAARSSRIYDIGSGNGLPGLILAILSSDKEVAMVEKDARKVEFLKHCIHRLNLKNAVAIQARLEDLKPETIECGVSRGFAPLGRAIITARKSFAVGGEYYHLKSENWTREIANLPPQICAHWAAEHAFNYKIPEDVRGYSIVKTTKRS